MGELPTSEVAFSVGGIAYFLINQSFPGSIGKKEPDWPLREGPAATLRTETLSNAFSKGGLAPRKE